jgi:hypothetical protein
VSTHKSARKKMVGSKTGRVIHPRDEVTLTRKNWTLFGVALGVIVAGYIALALGSITLAPLLLVAGYCVLIPWAILARE